MHKDTVGLFDQLLAENRAITLNDVRLRTGYSQVMPDEIDLTSKFTRNVPVEIPISSAAMDTVTEYSMAIALAKFGGIGVIHKNLSPAEQAYQVDRTKYYLNGRLDSPKIVRETDTIKSIQMRRVRKCYSFESFPVLNSAGRLVGLITATDFKFCEDDELTAGQVMSRRLITGSQNTTLEQAYQKMQRSKKSVLPLVDGNRRLKGMYVFSDVQRILKGSSNVNTDQNGRLRVAAAVGTGRRAYNRVARLIEKNVDVIVIDTAHGDSEPVFQTLKYIKRKYPDQEVVVGNVSEGESCTRLISAGADGIKVGQGPGSICTTRIIAGIGSPQCTAVYMCVKAAAGTGVPIIADGGLKTSGDIPIILGLGASCVMLGGMLAGTDEAPGETLFYNGARVKRYRGMGSLSAMKKNRGARERYLQGDVEQRNRLVPEGIEGNVRYKGPLEDVLHQYLGGLRAGMGYVGAASIRELHDKARYFLITQNGLAESHPHDVNITEDAPNYTRR